MVSYFYILASCAPSLGIRFPVHILCIYKPASEKIFTKLGVSFLCCFFLAFSLYFSAVRNCIRMHTNYYYYFYFFSGSTVLGLFPRIFFFSTNKLTFITAKTNNMYPPIATKVVQSQAAILYPRVNYALASCYRQ